MKILLLCTLLLTCITTKATNWEQDEPSLSLIARNELIIQTEEMDEKQFYSYDIGLTYRITKQSAWEFYYQNQIRIERTATYRSIEIMDRRSFWVTYQIKY